MAAPSSEAKLEVHIFNGVIKRNICEEVRPELARPITRRRRREILPAVDDIGNKVGRRRVCDCGIGRYLRRRVVAGTRPGCSAN
ncbi:hypothetical protein HPP92_020828 [Vanilla planifolia]|uniref:Uncharacterized protein n=1 Tax=Vanilla planifolia TaxID=51239 RepID=A0A835UHY8_VANPL|nr:hypothetical protein HPP92_021142 [Vanilla planifolia]KAG0462352.1 hypothetical protein HPP92_020828 [Vanilla planifolia]